MMATDTATTEAERSNESSQYVVLARRYRPSQLQEVIGQQHITRTITNAITAGRLHHAYLFCGSRGVGKTTVARILAKALNCEKGPTPTPCDQCTTCLEIKNGSSVDVFEIDGASHTGVDNVRQLIENARYLPAHCRYKIFIIDEVHMLSQSAFNALLKILEEPPAHVIFILATTDPQKIIATVLSRCQRFEYKRLSETMLIDHLSQLCQREHVEITRDGLAIIARAAEGSVRDSLTWLDSVIAASPRGEAITAEQVAEVLGLTDSRVYFRLTQALLAREAAAALAVVDDIYQGGKDLAQFAKSYLWHLRNLVVARTCQEPGKIIEAPESELKELIAMATGAGAELLPQYFARFTRVAEEIGRSNFPRLILEMAVIEMAHAEPLLPLGDLLDRLEELEARLGGATGNMPSSPSGGGPRITSKPPTSFSAPRNNSTGAQSASAPTVANATSISAAPISAASISAASISAAPISAASNIALATGDDLFDRWQSLIHTIEQNDPLTANVFVSGRLLSWNKDELIIGFPAGSFEISRASARDKQAKFLEECQRVLGRSLSLAVREMTSEEIKSPTVARMSVVEEQNRKREERQRRQKDEAQGHPVTRSLVDSFNAKIDNITVEVDER